MIQAQGSCQHIEEEMERTAPIATRIDKQKELDLVSSSTRNSLWLLGWHGIKAWPQRCAASDSSDLPGAKLRSSEIL